MYHIEEILAPKLDVSMRIFIDDYLSTEFRYEHFENDQVDDFKEVFLTLASRIVRAKNNLKHSDYEHFVAINLHHSIPYVVVVNELSYIKDIFIHELLEKKAVDGVIFLCKLFDVLLNDIANIYLKNYIKDFYLRNHLRMRNLSEMKKNHIAHYEAHLKWLDKLVCVMDNKNIAEMPEVNPSLCIFGHWLNNNAKSVFSDDKKYNKIVSLHKTLHFIASKIEHMLISNNCDCNAGMVYLEKAEFISLEIGTELALLDNKLIVLKATKDPLTEMLNRSLLEQLFNDQYEFSFVTETPFVLLMCDLDHFKEINDNYGHSEGDFVLKAFARILKKQLRSSDLIFRYGGDEFLIILPASNKKEARNRLNKVKEELAEKFNNYGEKKLPVTFSAGILEIMPSIDQCMDMMSYKTHISEVDQALYQAKSDGKNCIRDVNK